MHIEVTKIKSRLVYIATCYGLDGRESNPGGWKIFPAMQAGHEAHPASCTIGTGPLPRVNGRSVALTTHVFLVLRCEWFTAMPPPSLCARISMSWGKKLKGKDEAKVNFTL